MDPATIGLLIIIAPTVLDLLFGRGHIKESSRQQRYPLENMYGYGLEGYGYRYPRRRRKLTVETYYPEAVQPDLVRATVFNRAIAKKNDWITFLRSNDYFNKIRELLKDATAKYRAQKPLTEKGQKSLQRHLTKLQAELNVSQNEAQNKRLVQEFAQKYPGLSYTTVLDEKIAQLQREINRIQQSMPTSESQQLVPK
jgi:uncharacterized small protein (DUF1192 family)